MFILRNAALCSNVKFLLVDSTGQHFAHANLAALKQSSKGSTYTNVSQAMLRVVVCTQISLPFTKKQAW
jgi:hypothetical protein